MKTPVHVMLLSVALIANSQTAAAQDAAPFCGRASGEPAAIQADIAKAPGIKKVHRSADYVAYQDEATGAVFTFTQEAVGPAHPAAVCRKPVKDGDNLTLQMVILCKGESNACQVLESDFKLLNAQMEAAIKNEAARAAEQK